MHPCAALPWRAVHTLFSVSPWAYLSVSLPLSFCLRVCFSFTPHAFLHWCYFELFSPGQTRKQISLSIDISSVQRGRDTCLPSRTVSFGGQGSCIQLSTPLYGHSMSLCKAGREAEDTMNLSFCPFSSPSLPPNKEISMYGESAS